MRIGITIAVVLLALGVCAQAAWASGGEDGLGLGKQLNWWSIATSIVIFLVLLAVLSKTAWKPILEGLQKREETIKGALDEAKDAHEQAKALIAEYEAKIDKARDEAQAIFEETRRDAQVIRDQIEEDARKRADETIARATREIEQAHAKAWDRLVRDASAIAGEAAKRIIQRELSAEGHADIVSAVVSEYARKSGRAGGA